MEESGKEESQNEEEKCEEIEEGEEDDEESSGGMLLSRRRWVRPSQLTTEWGDEHRALERGNTAQLSLFAEKKEGLFLRRRHNCWLHCDFPSECYHAVYKAQKAGRFVYGNARAVDEKYLMRRRGVKGEDYNDDQCSPKNEAVLGDIMEVEVDEQDHEHVNEDSDEEDKDDDDDDDDYYDDYNDSDYDDDYNEENEEGTHLPCDSTPLEGEVQVTECNEENVLSITQDGKNELPALPTNHRNSTKNISFKAINIDADGDHSYESFKKSLFLTTTTTTKATTSTSTTSSSTPGNPSVDDQSSLVLTTTTTPLGTQPLEFEINSEDSPMPLPPVLSLDPLQALTTVGFGPVLVMSGGMPTTLAATKTVGSEATAVDTLVNIINETSADNGTHTTAQKLVEGQQEEKHKDQEENEEEKKGLVNFLATFFIKNNAVHERPYHANKPQQQHVITTPDHYPGREDGKVEVGEGDTFHLLDDSSTSSLDVAASPPPPPAVSPTDYELKDKDYHHHDHHDHHDPVSIRQQQQQKQQSAERMLTILTRRQTSFSQLPPLQIQQEEGPDWDRNMLLTPSPAVRSRSSSPPTEDEDEEGQEEEKEDNNGDPVHFDCSDHTTIVDLDGDSALVYGTLDQDEDDAGVSPEVPPQRDTEDIKNDHEHALVALLRMRAAFLNGVL